MYQKMVKFYHEKKEEVMGGLVGGGAIIGMTGKAHAALADITGAASADLTSISTALSALFVTGIGIAILALGYRKMKGGVNKV